jgi:hypothetical protein
MLGIGLSPVSKCKKKKKSFFIIYEQKFLQLLATLIFTSLKQHTLLRVTRWEVNF